MKVLVGCEYSGTVRDAFLARGHDAISCDLLPSESPGPHHHGSVFEIIGQGFDLAIFHPPCTYLTVSANRWLEDQEPRNSGVLVGAERRAAVEEAAWFFMVLMNANIPKIAIENPIGVMSSRYRKPDQVVQPWMFGHGETKATCLWLKNLPLLIPTHMKDDMFAAAEPVEREQKLYKLSPGPDRWKDRSRTFQGIANAMAEQWA